MWHYINNVNWDNGIVGVNVSDPKYINVDPTFNGGDGIHGYNAAIRGTGKYHVRLKYISKGSYDVKG